MRRRVDQRSNTYFYRFDRRKEQPYYPIKTGWMSKNWTCSSNSQRYSQDDYYWRIEGSVDTRTIQVDIHQLLTEFYNGHFATL